MVWCSRDDEVALGRLRAPFVWRALVEPSVQHFEIYVKDEHCVEQIDELRKVAGTSAEEGEGLMMVGHQSSHSNQVPDVVPVHGALDRFTSRGVALIGKVPIAVDGLKATPGQLLADSGLPRSRDALDEIVACTHRSSIQLGNAFRQRPLLLRAAIRSGTGRRRF